MASEETEAAALVCIAVPDCEGRWGAAFGLLSVEEPTAHPGPEGRMWGRARIRGNGAREEGAEG